jgi:hypothetical protein
MIAPRSLFATLYTLGCVVLYFLVVGDYAEKTIH